MNGTIESTLIELAAVKAELLTTSLQGIAHNKEVTSDVSIFNEGYEEAWEGVAEFPIIYGGIAYILHNKPIVAFGSNGEPRIYKLPIENNSGVVKELAPSTLFKREFTILSPSLVTRGVQ